MSEERCLRLSTWFFLFALLARMGSSTFRFDLMRGDVRVDEAAWTFEEGLRIRCRFRLSWSSSKSESESDSNVGTDFLEGVFFRFRGDDRTAGFGFCGSSSSSSSDGASPSKRMLLYGFWNLRFRFCRYLFGHLLPILCKTDEIGGNGRF